MSKRESFNSHFAFIMALAGSAIGLGNIWRFPYLVGDNGGAAFILIYLLCSALVSVPIFICESLVGIKSKANAYTAYDVLAPGTKWKYAGLLSIIGSFIILSFYSVVGGWSIDFFCQSLSFSDFGSFDQIRSSITRPIIAFTAFLGLTALITSAGVTKGIEFFNKICMPILFVIIVFLALYSCSLEGGAEGMRYLLKPDFSKLNSHSLVDALGQSFLSLSLGIGCVLTYSSYMDSSTSPVRTGFITAFFDIFFALIAAFVIMPAVFAAGVQPSAGPSLVFETLPYIFTSMATEYPFMSHLVAILFFFTILIAALSSSISMFEVVVAYVTERFNISRKKSSLIIFCCIWVIGLFCSLSFGVLSHIKIFGEILFSFFDTLTSNYIMIIGSLVCALFVGWKMKKEEVRSMVGRFLFFIIRWFIPPVILIIFISGFIK